MLMFNTLSASRWSRLAPVFSSPALLLAACLLLLLPTWLKLAQTVWTRDEQGHGPLILLATAWLLFRARHDLAALPAPRHVGSAWLMLAIGLLAVAFGRSQSIIALEVGAQCWVMAALVLLFKGSAGLARVGFPIAFLAFMIPLPEVLVVALTAPLKTAVAAVSAAVLHTLGYPVGRSGVVMMVGPYQMFVADACAGLSSMFTLEAMVLLYANLMGYRDTPRNLYLALMAVPVAFVANVVRVLVLILITYYWGDEAGQGFVHGFAGILLLLVALAMISGVDSLYDLVKRRPRKS